MEKEEKILKDYIENKISGGDNVLKAAVGSINAQRTKELTGAINNLHGTVNLAASNLMTNLGFQTGNLNRGIETQVNNLIASSERLSQSNEDNSKKTHRLTIWNIILTAVSTTVAFAGILNIYYTYQIKNESVRTNQINEQPFLNFTDFNDRPYKFTNSGKGVATNFILIVWDKYAKQLYATPEGSVGEALAINVSTSINPSDLTKTNFEHIKQIPAVEELLREANKKDTSWFALVYEDIYANPYATLIRGPGGNYTENVKFIKLKKN